MRRRTLKGRITRTLAVVMTAAMVSTSADVTAFAAGYTPKAQAVAHSVSTQASIVGTWTSGGTKCTLDSDGVFTVSVSGDGRMSNYNKSSEQPWTNKSSSIKKIVIESGVKYVGKYTFADSTAVKDVEISGSVEEIGSYAFSGCRGLKSVDFKEKGLKYIDGQAFMNCWRLESVNLKEGLETIGIEAFYKCGIYSIVIPASVTEIGWHAFCDCSVQKSLYILGNPIIGTDSKNYNNNTLGGDTSRKIVLYYLESNNSVASYANSNKNYYITGNYADVEFTTDTEQTVKVTADGVSETATYTANIAGIINFSSDTTFELVSNNGTDVKEIGLTYTHDKENKTITFELTPTEEMEMNENEYVRDYEFKIKASGTYNTKKTDYVKVWSTDKSTSSDAVIKLSVEKREHTDVQSADKHISNAGNETIIYELPENKYGAKYNVDNAVVTSNNGFENTVNNITVENNILKFDTVAVADLNKTTEGELKIKIPVVNSGKYKDYYYCLNLKVNKSPDAVSDDAQAITIDYSSITINGADTLCEYAIKETNGGTYPDKWTKVDTDGENIKFDNLKMATFYTIGVRYPAKDGVSATLPSETEVNTLVKKPEADEGYSIDYVEEKIILKSGYEVRLKKDNNSDDDYSSLPIDIDAIPGATYEVRMKGDKSSTGVVIKPSDAIEFTIPERDKSPDKVGVVERNNVTNNTITIINTKADYQYIIIEATETGENKFEPTAKQWIECTVSVDKDDVPLNLGEFKNENGVAHELESGKTYNILARIPADKNTKKFASEYSKITVTMKTTQDNLPDISEIFTGCPKSVGNVKINAKTGCEYILVPADVTEKDVADYTDTDWEKAKAVKSESDVNLDLTQYYDKKSGEVKNVTEGTEYKVIARYYGDDDKMPSKAGLSDATYTIYSTPSSDVVVSDTDGISFDYAAETVILNGSTYEVYVPSSWSEGELDENVTATLTAAGASTSITKVIDYSDNRYVYVRKKGSGNVPASAWVSVALAERGAAPEPVKAPDIVSMSDGSIIVRNASADYEYVLESDGGTVSWGNAVSPSGNESTVTFASATVGMAYKIHVRKKADSVSNIPASKYASTAAFKTQSPVETDVTTGMTDISKNTSSTVWVNGKSGYEYILVPKGTDASDVTEEQWKLNGQRPETEDGSDVDLTFDRTYNASSEDDKNITPGTEYEVIVRRPGSDTKIPSSSNKSGVTYTKQTTPNADEILNNAENGISIDYSNETVTINGDVYEVYVPSKDDQTEPTHGTNATISGDGKSADITDVIDGGKKIYVRKKANGSVPASDWLVVDINGRPETPPAVPEIPRENVTNNTITIPGADKDCEYIVVKKTTPQTVPTEEQWKNNSTSLGGDEQTRQVLHSQSIRTMREMDLMRTPIMR